MFTRYPVGVCVSCLLFILLAVLASAVQAGYEIPICTATTSQGCPAVSGNVVVWSDGRNQSTSSMDIYGYDLSTGQEFPICTAPNEQALPDIFGSIVVWEDGRNRWSTKDDIYGYDLSTGLEFPICTAPDEQKMPAISGNIVVWVDRRNNVGEGSTNMDIYGYDLSTGQEFPICTAPGNQWWPAVSGNIVVWSDERNRDSGDTGDIYGYDLATGQEFPICTASDEQALPDISGNIVVWADRRNWETSGNGDIYGYDLSTGQEFPICTAPGWQYIPAVSGNIVVWEDQRNWDPTGSPNWDIYGYDLSTRLEFSVCAAPGGQYRPDISGNVMVWTDNRNDLAGYPGGPFEADIWGFRITNGPEPSLGLSVNKTVVDLGIINGPTEDASVYIYNTAGGSFNWTVYSAEPWLIVTPATGTISTEHDYLNISVNPNWLAGGAYSRCFTVARNDDPNDFETITVNFTYQPSDAPSTGLTERVSVSSAGEEGNGYHPSISGDGRFVAFWSGANNLVPGDTNGVVDVFVHDRQTDHTERVSVSSAGEQGNGNSDYPSISADGRFVAFESEANDLVPGDTNETSDIFIHDRETGITERISVNSAGEQGDGYSYGRPSITGDGRFVAFSSEATNLVLGDTNGSVDAFVHDRQTGLTERVNLSSAGEQSNASAGAGGISADGRFVAFSSSATNLVPGDTNHFTDVFVHDRQTGATARVSIGSGGSQANYDCFGAAISADGRFVAFESCSNLVPGDTNGLPDIFVRDRQTGLTERVSISSAGEQGNYCSQSGSISADGRFVAFESRATSLVPGDTNGWIEDIYVRDRQTGATERVSVSSNGEQGNSYSYGPPSISADGRFVAFSSEATNLVRWDTNVIPGVFVRDRLADSHQIYLDASANPAAITSGGTTQLNVYASDSLGHGIAAWSWSDNGAGGTFSPSASAQYPTWTAPGNRTAAAIERRLTLTATCAGSPAVSASLSRYVVEESQLRPINLSPPDGANAVPATVTLSASPFTGLIPGDTHAASQWQISGYLDRFDSGALAWDSGEDPVNLTQVTVPAGALYNFGQSYWWRVRYRDNNGLWSAFSIPTSFTLEAWPPPDLAVNRNTIELGTISSATGDDSLSIYNAGGGACSWTAISDSPWLSIAPAAGTAASGPLPLHLMVEPTGLPDGPYSGTITLTHDFVPADSETITVSFTYQAAGPPPSGASELASVTSAEEQGDADSYAQAVSPDGRWLVFGSEAANLLPGDGNGSSDVFVRDRLTGVTECVSLNSFGNHANDDSWGFAISADGRYVAFTSEASNLTPDDFNGLTDIFVRDRTTATTWRISLGQTTINSNGSSWGCAMSADGRFVVFYSNATNLTGEDTNGVADLFVRDRLTGVTEVVTLSSAGAPADGPPEPWASISADGRYVAFASYATNLVAGDTNNVADVFVRDRLNQTTFRASVGALGEQADSACLHPSLSADGRFVTFEVAETNLIADGNGQIEDILARDLQSGLTELVSVNNSNEQGNANASDPAISADGNVIVFSAGASNLVVGDVNAVTDVFARDRALAATERVSLSSGGQQGNAASWTGGPVVSSEGRYVAFHSYASNLSENDTNAALDVFVRDRTFEHSLYLAASADPDRIGAGGLTQLTAEAWDNWGHGIASWSWSDHGAGGLFSPGAEVRNPTWTAPGNSTGAPVTRWLTVTAVCDGSPALARAADLYLIEEEHYLDNWPPAQPTNQQPPDGAGNVLIAPTLRASAFSDNDPGDSHAASQWQVSRAASFDVSNLVWDSGRNTVDLTSVMVSPRDLQVNTTYWWRVRYQDAGSMWSEYSLPTSFTTLSATAPDLALSAATLSLGAISGPTGDTSLYLYNAGIGEFEWNATCGANWLNVMPAGGRLSSGPQTLYIMVDPVGLADGSYSSTITFSRAGEPSDTETVTVSFTCQGAAPAPLGATARASVNASGEAGDADTYAAAVSAEGRFLLLTSDAANLVPEDTNNASDVFVRDLQTGAIERVSVNSMGQQATGASSGFAISPDGRFVAFNSDAGNLVPQDGNDKNDVFVRDRHTNTTWRVSLSSSGAEGNADAWGSAMSADGRYLVFVSAADNLVANDTNGQLDVFVRDRWTGTTERVNLNDAGEPANQRPDFWCAISADGRYVAFASSATNLVAGDTNGQSDIFLRDRLSGTTELVSVEGAGVQMMGPSLYPSLSAEGRCVAFESYVEGSSRIFVRDRQTGSTELASADNLGVPGNRDSWAPALAANGNYVAFTSEASNLVDGDVNAASDVFARDLQTGATARVSIGSGGRQGNNDSMCNGPVVSATGQLVAFSSLADNLVAGDTNQAWDAFVRDRTTGHEFTVSVSADPATIGNGGATQLSADIDDTWGHGASFHWSDDGVGGAFTPNADAQHPVWTAPGNSTGAPIARWLTVTATCDGSPALARSASMYVVEEVTFFDPPLRPVNEQPVEGAMVPTLTPTLSASAFQDFDPGDVHAASQWQVTLSEDSFASADLAWDSGADALALTTVTIPPGVLEPAAVYWWRVRYQDNDGTWSSYSLPTSFFTPASATPDLQANRNQLNLGSISGPTTDSSVYVYNAGPGQIYWVAGETVSWLSVAPTSGLAADEPDYLTIMVDPTNLAVGSYTGQLVIQREDDPGDTETINVTFFYQGGAGPLGASERASVSSAGAAGDADSYAVALSADGRFVVINSESSNLVEHDTNGAADVFVRDRQTGATELVSVNNAAGQGEKASQGFAISADGRYVAFNSLSGNFVPGDTNNASDVFLHDRTTGATRRISLGNSGEQATAGVWGSAMTPEARYLVFVSAADNLVPNDTNGAADVFLRDLVAGTTELISRNSAGQQADGKSDFWASISADGRYVAFASYATNLVSGDDNGVADIFLRDRQTGATTRVSIGSAGEQAESDSLYPALSADGRCIAFESEATNLAPDANGRAADILVHDQQTGQTERVNLSSAGEQGNAAAFTPALSADGRFVIFHSEASNLVEGDVNAADDVFCRDRQAGATERISLNSAGQQGNDDSWCFGAIVSAEGRWVAFHSLASNLVPNDTNQALDVFVRDRTPSHNLSVSASAEPDAIGRGGATQLSAAMSDSLGHEARTWQWSDGGAGGTFLPGAEAQNPVWTAPGNSAGEPTAHRLTVTVTCAGPPAESASAEVTVTEDIVEINTPPTRPVNEQPADGAIEVSLTPTLAASAFFDLNPGDALAASQWQVSSSGGDFDPANLVWDCSAFGSQTSNAIYGGVLQPATNYWWRVRYRDGFGAWSEYSQPTCFTTETFGLPNLEVNRNLVVLGTITGPASTESVQVYNTGPGSLAWTIGNSTAWLSVFPNAGITGSSQNPLHIMVDPTGLAEGSHSGSFTVSRTDLPADAESVMVSFSYQSPGGPVTGATSRASVNSDQAESDDDSYVAAITPDGRFVAITSSARNLALAAHMYSLESDINVFVRDRASGATEVVSVNSAGEPANGNSWGAGISSDGRYMLFTSNAYNLVPDDTNGRGDVFLRDRQTGLTERVSLSSAGEQSNADAWAGALSADGRYVVFVSAAGNLVANDGNGVRDVFLRDRVAGTTELVSVNSAGEPANRESDFWCSISADGRYVAFASYATNLVPEDTNGVADIFVRDRQTGATYLASVSSAGQLAEGASLYPVLSADGRLVAFESGAGNLVPEMHVGRCSIFVHDLQTGATELVSASSSAEQANQDASAPAISPEGRFVAFSSHADNLVPGDVNIAADVFLHDRQLATTTRVSINGLGQQGNADSWFLGPVVGTNGEYVAFHSLASNLVEGDTNDAVDVFVYNGTAAHSLYVNASADPTEIASGGSVQLGATSSDELGHGAASWSWDDNGAGGVFSPSADVQNPTWTAPGNSSGAPVPRQLTVTATCDGDPAAVGSDTVTVTEDATVHAISIEAAANPTIVASGGTTQLTSIAQCNLGHELTYSWSDNGAGGGFSPSAEVPGPTWTAPGNSSGMPVQHLLTVSVTCNGTPAASQSLSMYVTEESMPLLAAEAGPDQWLADGGSVALLGMASGGLPPHSYSWTPTTGLSDPNIAQPIASPVETTTYTLTVQDALAHTASDTVTVNTGVLSGWPIDTGDIIQGSPALGDLDGDGDLEVVVGSANGRVYALQHNGDLLAGWPKETGDAVVSSPTLADLAGDGRPEVLATSLDGNVYVWNGDGAALAGWPQSTGAWIGNSPAVGDLDGDGDPEIVVSNGDGAVYAWHTDGSALLGWPQLSEGEVFTAAALGELDGQPGLEVVMATVSGSVYVWRGNGQALAGWPIVVGSAVEGSPAVGDLEGDGDLEIVLGTADGKVYAWHSNGGAVTGWPQTAGSSETFHESPALGDINGDGSLEVIAGNDTSGAVYAWSANGTPLSGWPIVNGALSAPALGDLDGEGRPEVVIGAQAGVYAYAGNGAAVASWPKHTGGPASGQPVLGDLDNDGDLEVVAGCEDGLIYAWSSGLPSDDSLPWPMFRRDARHTARYQPPVFPPVAEFSGTPTTGTVPLTVDFTDQSTGTVNSWLWSFGDSATSTERNPSHTYQDPGTYTVSLTVTGPVGVDTKTKSEYIVASPVHVLTVNAFADPTDLPCGGTTQLSATASDTWGHGIVSWSWGDHGAGGSFTPGANVQSPLWSAPGNNAGTPVQRQLTVTADCGSASESSTVTLSEGPRTYHLTVIAQPAEGGVVTGEGDYPTETVVTVTAAANVGWTFDHWTGPVADQYSATTTVTITAEETVTAVFAPIVTATLGAQDAVGGAGKTAAVPMVIDLGALQADRFAFSLQVTPEGGAPALVNLLGYQAAPGLPPPGLIAPAGNSISVAWFEPLEPPLSGVVDLGHLLVPVPADAAPGQSYQVTMISVGSSLGEDELTTVTGPPATLRIYPQVLVGDTYPAKTDLNGDGDTNDYGEFGNGDISWGDVIFAFDNWALPDGEPPVGSDRFSAVDSYPKDTESAPGGDNTLTWGDVITTFDRWANPTLPRPWRLLVGPGASPRPAGPEAKSAATLGALAATAPTLEIAAGAGLPGETLRLRVQVNLAGQQADRVAFSLMVTSLEPGPLAEIVNFEPAAGLGEPMITALDAGSLAVAWLNPIETPLSGVAYLGDLLVKLPEGALPGSQWFVTQIAVGASRGEAELEPRLTAGEDATLEIATGLPHDVGVLLRAPKAARVGSTCRLVVELVNHTGTTEQVSLRLLRNGEPQGSLPVSLAGGGKRRLEIPYTFTRADRPVVELGVEAILPGDAKPGDNLSTRKVRVR